MQVNEFDSGGVDDSASAEETLDQGDASNRGKPSQSRRKYVLAFVFLLLLILGIVGAFILYGIASPKRTDLRSESDTSPIASLSSPDDFSILTVAFTPKEPIFEQVTLSPYSDEEMAQFSFEEGLRPDTYTFYNIGSIAEGKYKGGNLIVAEFSPGGYLGKGPNIGRERWRLRYVLLEDEAILLTKISYPFRLEELAQRNPFDQFGYTLQVDTQTTVPILEYPETLLGENDQQLLTKPQARMLIEEAAAPDQTKLDAAFVHPIFGNIYTTKAGLGSQRSFELKEQGGAFGSGVGTVGCIDENCFNTNLFFAFRPDGTFLKYEYTPNLVVADIIWTDDKTTGEEYVSYTVAGCSRQELDATSVVSDSLVQDADLVPVGRVNNRGNVYALRDENHLLYTEFYETYAEYFAGPYVWAEEDKQIKSYADFLNSRPIFFWRDPFGRLIRFNNNAFLPPHACEPIIYLYPESTQQVSVSLDPVVRVTASTPEYAQGWEVMAEPNGTLRNLADGMTYPYIFWEGWSLIFPMRKEGFVVAQNEVQRFLSEILPKLGLNQQETADFLKAWLPEFTDSPHYFITFVEPAFIDIIAPLHVTPQPDTVIRILMEAKPLTHPVVTTEPELPQSPRRVGFTVVEWGGLKR